MQMNDKQKPSASVIILPIYKPLSSPCRFFCVRIHASGISLFLEAYSVHFYALIFSGFSNYSLLDIHTYPPPTPNAFICQEFFFFDKEWRVRSIKGLKSKLQTESQSTRLKDARFRPLPSPYLESEESCNIWFSPKQLWWIEPRSALSICLLWSRVFYYLAV